ncbi:hypothetical protein P7K49_022866, partial [Saguinus oedipus]
HQEPGPYLAAPQLLPLRSPLLSQGSQNPRSALPRWNSIQEADAESLCSPSPAAPSFPFPEHGRDLRSPARGEDERGGPWGSRGCVQAA